MDNMKDIQEISDEQAVILWQASRLSLSEKYEKAPEILSVKGSVIGTLGNFSASWKSHATLTPLAKQDCPPLATI